MRRSMLPKNQSAGRRAERPLRTVHQRPAKKIAPSTRPAAPASNNGSGSFIVRPLVISHCLFFIGDPMPRVQTTNREPHDQERERPGMGSGMMFVQPDAECGAE